MDTAGCNIQQCTHAYTGSTLNVGTWFSFRCMLTYKSKDFSWNKPNHKNVVNSEIRNNKATLCKQLLSFRYETFTHFFDCDNEISGKNISVKSAVTAALRNK